MATNLYHHFARAGGPGAPLVFAFHGTGGDEHQFTALIGQILPEAGIVAPRGDVSEQGASRFFRRTAEGVYDMPDLAARTQRMTAFLRAHRDANPGRAVHALGYSNGANILASVLFGAPELFDRVVLMHPLIPWTPADQPGLEGRQLLLTAGRRDPICPLPRTQALADWLAAQGARTELALHDGGHEIAPAELGRIADFLRRA
ncbi:MAG TPA: alpha/beta hydrolase [Paracoccus solventivorans]|uniref:alpha/beta hydrolase n=1 Tax=Paracoccus solventivorans TaxID=53463 RepID=UPI002D147E71|nr:alpha/beta hydrolase [Paracoccus solventivorans]HMM07922.1 alpha/beta hydrolase [Paracoccus solventivorans]